MRETKKSIMAGVESEKSILIANNTVEYHQTGKRVIRLHQTDIITFHKNHIILNSGGWKTITTKDRLNRFQSLCNIYQGKGIWYAKTKTGMESVFYDGIKILNTGRIIKPKQDDKRTARLIRQINAYCKKLSGLKTLPEPSQGDCWDCLFKTPDGKTMGEINKSDHLLSHLKEKYIHGTLILNALKLAGCHNPGFIFHFDCRDIAISAVKRYFKKQLSIAC